MTRSSIKFILILLLIFIVSIDLYYHYKVWQTHKLPNHELSGVLSTLKTGDLIFTRHNYTIEYRLGEHLALNVVSTLLSSQYTHVGIIVILENKLYAYSAYRDGKYDHINNGFKNGGTALVDLASYAENYKGDVVIYRTKLNLVDIDAFYKQIEVDKHLKFENNKYRMLNSVIKLHNIADKSRTYCTEITVKSLKSLGIIDTQNRNLIDIGDLEEFAKTSKLYEDPIIIDNKYYKKYAKYGIF